jgi:hypothetical protein
MAGLTHEAIIARLEASGEMDQRREQIRAWFSANPNGSPVQAVAAHPEWRLPDHMVVVADSILMDMRVSAPAVPHPV